MKVNKVKVIYSGLIQTFLRRKEEEVHLPEEATLRQRVILLSHRHEEFFRNYLLDVNGGLRVNVAILINGANADDLEGLDTKLKQAVQVSIVVTIPQLGGGRWAES